jgi:hypothetical protein
MFVNIFEFYLMRQSLLNSLPEITNILGFNPPIIPGFLITSVRSSPWTIDPNFIPPLGGPAAADPVVPGPDARRLSWGTRGAGRVRRRRL